MLDEKKILIIDDEETIRFSLKAALSKQGYKVYLAGSAEEGYKMINQEKPQLIFLDLRLPGQDGYTALKKIKAEHEGINVVIITAYGDTKSTVMAVKEGAYDYINKPFDLDEILLITEKIFKSRSIEQQAELFQYQQNSLLHNKRFIGKSAVMQDVLGEIKKVAVTDTTVLLFGETGTGKEMAASLIHMLSSRNDKPFIDINCGAIPLNLVESELLGYEKNAFTGATSAKKGLFELADGGTVFLDEVGELPLDIQVKLLRFLETRTFKRLGGTKDITVNIRIIAATNKNLQQLVIAGKFREDLFYRLNVVPFVMPPLRERKEDIQLMAEAFRDEFSKALGKPIKPIAAELKQALLEYHWPGNVRELKNLMERLVILSDDNQDGLHINQLPSDFFSSEKQGNNVSPIFVRTNLNEDHASEEDVSYVTSKILNSELASQLSDTQLDSILEGIEKRYVDWALTKTRWNMSKAAELLGINRFALKRKAEKYFPQ